MPREDLLKKIPLVIVLLVAALFGYTRIMVRIGSGEPPGMHSSDRQAGSDHG